MPNVKQKVAWLWQNLEKLLIILFFLTFSFNVRKVFLTPYSFLNGGFNEYATFSLGWTDVLIIASIIIYTIKYVISQLSAPPGNKNILYNNYQKSSIFKSPSISRETTLWLFFFFWCGLSISWSSYKPFAIFRFASLLEVAIFAVILIRVLKETPWFQAAILALVVNGVFQSFLGIAQFIQNGSLGLSFFGESIIGPNIAGAAKIIIAGQKHIRSYGTFPHPNILAAFLLIPLFIVMRDLLFYRINVSRETSTKTFSFRILVLIFPILITGFALTASRSAFFGFALGSFLLFLAYRKALFKLWNNSTGFTLTQKRAVLASLIIFLAIGISYAAKYTSFFSFQALNERNTYQIVSYETISAHFYKGVGLGQFVINEYLLHPNLNGWQYQPVHNIFLLIFSELGIVGFVIGLYLIITFILKKVIGITREVRLTNYIYCVIIISFLPPLLFDHFFWDLKIGMILFSVPVSLFLANSKYH